MTIFLVLVKAEVGTNIILPGSRTDNIFALRVIISCPFKFNINDPRRMSSARPGSVEGSPRPGMSSSVWGVWGQSSGQLPGDLGTQLVRGTQQRISGTPWGQEDCRTPGTGQEDTEISRLLSSAPWGQVTGKQTNKH